MNKPQPEPPEAAEPQLPEAPQRLEDVVHHIVWEIENGIMTPGDVAGLRRLDPDEPGGAAFWKALVFHVEPAEQLRADDAEVRWALILRTAGELHALNRRGRRLGSALAAAKVSEMRLTRLLRADLDSLKSTLGAVAHQLASAGEGVDLGDVAWLVVTARNRGESRRSEDDVRRGIARDYYRGLRKEAANTKPV